MSVFQSLGKGLLKPFCDGLNDLNDKDVGKCEPGIHIHEQL